MSLKIDEARRERLVGDLQGFFAETFDEDISTFRAEQILDFLLGAVGPQIYNQAVQDYNTAIQLFPSNLIAGLAGFTREEAYFRTTEAARQAPPPLGFSPEALEEEAPVEE